MARIRSIKPEVATDETLGRVSRDARLLFILLWTACDDHGRFRAAPEVLCGQLFPYDADVTPTMVEEWLKELEDWGRILRYSVKSERYGEVINWTRHQRVDNAGRAFYPPPQFAETHGDSPSEADGGQLADESHGDSPSPTLAASLGDSPLDHWDHRDHRDHTRESVPNLPSERAQKAAEETDVGGEDSLKQRRAKTLALLAGTDLAQAKAQGQNFRSDTGILKKLIADRDEVSGAVVDALIAEHPDWTPRRLHDAIAPPTADVVRPTEYEPEGVGNGVPMPASVKAQIDAALGRNRNRDNGEGG